MTKQEISNKIKRLEYKLVDLIKLWEETAFYKDYSDTVRKISLRIIKEELEKTKMQIEHYKEQINHLYTNIN